MPTGTQRGQKAIRSLRAKVKEGCELPDMGAGNQTQVSRAASTPKH